MLASDFEKYQFHSNTENGQRASSLQHLTPENAKRSRKFGSVVSGGYPILVGGGKKPTDNDWIIPLGLVWGAASSSDSTDDHHYERI